MPLLYKHTDNTSLRKSQSRLDIKRNDCISVIVHDLAVVGPITASNMSLAKGLAAERARQVLEDRDNPHYLKYICDCDRHQPTPPAQTQEIDATAPLEVKKLDDETEAGFAALALQVLTSIQPDDRNAQETTADSSFDDDEEEVDLLLGQVETYEMLVDVVPDQKNTQNGHTTTDIAENGLGDHHGKNGHVAVFTMDVDSDNEYDQQTGLTSAIDLTM